MLTLDQCRFSQLAILLAEIESSFFTGRVSCNSVEGDCELYFSKGALIYAQSIGNDQSGEDVIYELLNWRYGILNLESGVQTTKQNLAYVEVSSWREVVKIFQSRGIFERPLTPSPTLLLAEPPAWMLFNSAKPNLQEPSDDYITNSVSGDLEQTTPDLTEQADEAGNDNNYPSFTEMLHQLVIWNDGLKLTEGAAIPKPERKSTEKSQSLKIVEVNLLLPTGLLERQLLELLSLINFEQQLALLQQLRFTGYVYYGLPENSKAENRNHNQGDYGLVLFLEGCPTDLIYYEGRTETQQVGAQAYHTLTSFKQLIPEVYRVEARTLKAYRALLNGEQPYKNVSITGADFAGVVTAFSQSQRDGVALLYVESLKLYYFFLFEGGKQVGVFAPDFQAGQLQQLTPPLALPARNSEVVLTVMLASSPDFKGYLNWPVWDASSVESIISPTRPKSVELPHFQKDAQPLKELEEPTAVDWGNLFNSDRFPIGLANSKRYAK